MKQRKVCCVSGFDDALLHLQAMRNEQSGARLPVLMFAGCSVYTVLLHGVKQKSDNTEGGLRQQANCKLETPPELAQTQSEVQGAANNRRWNKKMYMLTSIVCLVCIRIWDLGSNLS